MGRRRPRQQIGGDVAGGDVFIQRARHVGLDDALRRG
jgi:hypothetical protein